jgi:hypothetical protein
MSSQEQGTYIPYQATAEAISQADESPRLFLLSLFPDATPEQLEDFKSYTVGKLLDGIHYGLELSGHDPLSPLEAYRLGEADGFDRAIIEQRTRRNEGD